MDLAKANSLLHFYPYQCDLCGTRLITQSKQVLEHINATRHRSACAANNVHLHCTSPDGSSCLTNELKACLFPRTKVESTRPPAQVDPLNLFSARLRSNLASKQLSALCDHVDKLAKTLNVSEVSSLLSEHGFKDVAWLHLEDNLSRVKALCVHIMHTNNLDLYQTLSFYFEKRRQEYEGMCQVFQDSSFKCAKESTVSPIGNQSSAEQEVIVLRAKIQQISNELEYHRRLQLNSASVTNSFEEQRSALSNLIRQEMSSLSAEQKRLIREEMSSLSAEQKKLIQEQTLTLKKATSQHDEGNHIPSGGKHGISKNQMQHLCSEHIQKSTVATVVNPKKSVDPLDKEWWWHEMFPVRPDATGVYPTVDCNSLGGDQDCMQVWKHIITTKENALSLTASNSLYLPPMYLPGSSSWVVTMYMTRRQPHFIGLYIFYHDKLRRNNPPISNTFNIKMEMTLRLRGWFWTEKQLNKSQTVTVRSDLGCGGVFLEVENLIALDPEVLPVLNVAITAVK